MPEFSRDIRFNDIARDVCGELCRHYDSSVFPMQMQNPKSQDVLIEQLRTLHAQGHDLGPVKASIARMETEHRGKVESILDGVLDVARLGKTKPKARRFLLAYHAKDGEAKIVEGVEYPDERADKSEDEYSMHVFVSGCAPCRLNGVHQYRLNGAHQSMEALKKFLNDRKIVFRIAYID